MSPTDANYIWEMEQLQKENANLNSQLAHYERKVDSLQKQIKEQEQQIRWAQEGVAKMIQKSKVVALPDDKIQSKLERLSKNWDSWAKENVHDNVEEIQQLILSNEVQMYEALQGFIRFDNGRIPQKLFFGKKPRSAMKVILYAMLANFICYELFDNPFWVLDTLEILEGETMRSPVAQKMFDILGEGRFLNLTSSPLSRP